MPAGDGVWRVWKVLEGLEGLEGFGRFGAFAGWQTAALKAHRKPLLWPGPGVPVGEVALALGCMLGKVFGILEVWILCRLANCSFEAHGKAFGGFGGFGEFWRVCGLANGSFESL